MREKSVKMTKILVFSPHPDDLDFGCSGTIAKWASDGKEITYCILSDGSRGGHILKISDQELAKIREKEQKSAAEILGAKDVIFLREKDGEIQNTKKLRKKLVEVIRKTKPDIILSFDPANCEFENFYRCHRDHRNGAEAVFDAIYPDANNESFFPEIFEKYPPHQVKEVWFFATNKPNVFVDISKTIEKKLEALRQHKSQIKDWNRVEKMIKDWAKTVGKKSKMKYAEGFRRVKLD
ncbi:MAG: PIG-L deacetylase family protein [bacterium]|nr:PIG-L deacetylase family protein [bacterium]